MSEYVHYGPKQVNNFFVQACETAAINEEVFDHHVDHLVWNPPQSVSVLVHPFYFGCIAGNSFALCLWKSFVTTS